MIHRENTPEIRPAKAANVELFVLRIEHRVNDFNAWKKVFDSDPASRQQAGVQRYTIFQLIDDPNEVVIDLEFHSLITAETFLSTLRKLWAKVTGKVIYEPKAKITRMVEAAISTEIIT